MVVTLKKSFFVSLCVSDVARKILLTGFQCEHGWWRQKKLQLCRPIFKRFSFFSLALLLQGATRLVTLWCHLSYCQCRGRPHHPLEMEMYFLYSLGNFNQLSFFFFFFTSKIFFLTFTFLCISGCFMLSWVGGARRAIMPPRIFCSFVSNRSQFLRRLINARQICSQIAWENGRVLAKKETVFLAISLKTCTDVRMVQVRPA